jgi:hypothetical protein
MAQTERVLDPLVEVGYLGMHATNEIPVPPRYVSLADNFFLEGRVWKMRPGVYQAGAQLTGGSGKDVQAVGHFLEMDGTYHTFAICNADLHTYNWTTDAWTLIDLAGAGVTCSASAKIDWAVSRGRLIATDGVNKPWMWDPANATYTVLSLAPIAGGVEIYYDKVFFYDLPGANSNVFEWSDEADPVNGYTTASQDWEFAQTDTGAVTCLKGMNETMPVFKEDSIALLKGSANDTFQTDAVREGVSETEGSPGKFGVIAIDGDIYYLSKAGPRMLQSGYRLLPLDMDSDSVNVLGKIWDTFAQGEVANAIVYHDIIRSTVTWLISEVGFTTKRTGLTYAMETGSWSTVTYSTDFDFQCAANVENLTGGELVFLGDADGNVWLYGDEYYWDDGAGYDCKIRSRQYGKSLGMVQKRLSQVDLVLKVTTPSATGTTRVFLNGITTADYFSDTDRSFYIPTQGMKRYRRCFNHVGWTVGWEFEMNTMDGTCELHQSMTQMTTVGMHPSRG